MASTQWLPGAAAFSSAAAKLRSGEQGEKESFLRSPTPAAACPHILWRECLSLSSLPKDTREMESGSGSAAESLIGITACSRSDRAERYNIQARYLRSSCPSTLRSASDYARAYSSPCSTTNGLTPRGKSIPPFGPVAPAVTHAGDCNSGIGLAWNSFLHCLAVHRAQL